ncbi:MAG: hypothetical protein OEU92_01190 [Alphaproteobacteria bacterium]|nr:hypothetical protein [Alphaproteobacteria bacterium]
MEVDLAVLFAEAPIPAAAGLVSTGDQLTARQTLAHGLDFLVQLATIRQAESSGASVG